MLEKKRGVKLRGRNSGAEDAEDARQREGLRAWKKGKIRSERGLLKD